MLASPALIYTVIFLNRNFDPLPLGHPP